MIRLGGPRQRPRTTVWLTLVLLTVPLAGTMAGGSAAADGCDLLRQGQILVPDAGAGAPTSNTVEDGIPDACAGVPFELFAGDPADDLDVCWHAADGSELDCFASPGNEAGTIPDGAAEARINHFAGADTTYTLRSVTYQAPMTLYFHDGTAPQGNAASLFVAGNEMDTSEPSRTAPASTYSIPVLSNDADNFIYNANWDWVPNTNVTFESVDLTVTFWAVSPGGTAFENSGWGVRIYDGDEVLAQRATGGDLAPTEPGTPARYDVTFEDKTFTTDNLRVQIDPQYADTDWAHTILYDSTDHPSGVTITPHAAGEADTTPPTAPANLTSVANGTTQTAIGWDPATDDTRVDSYTVYRGTSPDNLSPVAETASTSYLDGDLAAGTTYHYQVTATDAAGNQGPGTAIVEATTEALGAERTFFLHDVGPNDVQFLNELDTPGDNDASGYNALGGAAATAESTTGVGLLGTSDTFPADTPANSVLVLDPTRDITSTIYVQTDVAPASQLTLRLTLTAGGQTIATGTSQVLASSDTWTAATFTLDHAATVIQAGALSATVTLEQGASGYVFGYDGDHASRISLPEDASRPPAVRATVEADVVTAGQSVGFTAETVGGQAPLSYAWDLGDGSTATGTSVTHTYADPGRYDATVTVTDDLGRTAQHTIPVHARQADFHQDRVVVAVVDSGINPYHETFQRPGADLPLDSFVNEADGQAPRTVDLSDSGTYDDRVDADASIYAGIAPQELVHFEGTNVLGISFASEGPEPILDPAGHGTATSSTVLAAHPDAIIVQVQTTGGTLANAIGWAAEQPWIDVLSVSWGAAGNAPVGDGSIPAHTRGAYDDGKVIVNSAGNDPSPLPTDATDGPWWVLAVTGSQEGGQSKEILSSNIYPDYVSNYTVTAAAHDSVDGQTRIGGTSFSAPTVAGTVAGIVHELRKDAGHTTGIVGGEIAPGVLNTDIRAALNKTAALPAFDGYVAGINYNGDHTHPPAAPWTTAQWGQVDARTIAPAVQAIQTGDLDVPEEKSEVGLYKQTTFALRQAYWG